MKESHQARKFQMKMNVLEEKLNRKTFMTINLSEKLKVKLDMISSAEGKSRSELCREVLEGLVENYDVSK